MFARRVVEIASRRRGGTGYLLTPRHVLTARHVILPLERNAACTARPLAPKDAGSFAGKAAWFADPEAEPDLDVAVIELDRPVPLDGTEDVRCGWIALDDNAPHAFLCSGFPAAARNADRTVQGRLQYSPRLERLMLDVDGAVPRDWRQWAGLSGALVFCGSYAVGVVCTVDGDWDRTLTATPLRRLLDHAPFAAYWRAQGLPQLAAEAVERLEPSLMEEISPHVYLIDRKDVVSEVKEQLRALGGHTASRIFAIMGVEKDELRYVIRQLSEDTEFQRLLGREARSEQVIVPLPWPVEYPQINAEAHFREILGVLGNAAEVPPPSQEELPAAHEIRRSLDDGIAPRAYWTLVHRRNAYGGHAALLRRLIDFWESLGHGQPVILFLCLAWDAPEPPKTPSLPFFRKRQPEVELELELASATERLADRLVGVGPLAEIDGSHVDPWIDELRRRCRRARARQLDALRLSLLHRIGPGKRARDVAADLGELLAKS